MRSGGPGGDLFGYSSGIERPTATRWWSAEFDESGISNVIKGDLDVAREARGACVRLQASRHDVGPRSVSQGHQRDRNDSMGVWIAISDDGNTIAAGAADEDSMTPGVNAVGAVDRGMTDARGRYVLGRRLGVRPQRKRRGRSRHLQGLEHREGRLVRRPPGFERRRKHAGSQRAERRQRGEGDQRQAGRRIGRRSGRGVRLHAQRQHAGLTGPTSRARTPRPSTSSAARSR